MNRNNGEEFSARIDDGTQQDIIKGICNMIECKPTKQDSFKGINTMLGVKPSATLEEKNKYHPSNGIQNQESLAHIVDKIIQHDGVSRNKWSSIKETQRDGDHSMNNTNCFNTQQKVPLGISNALG